MRTPESRHRDISTYWHNESGVPSPILVVGGLAVLAVLMIFSGAQRAEPDTTNAIAVSTDQEMGAASEPVAPTPFFASYRSLQICLPIRPEEVTLLAFHQASGDKALSMDSLVPDADMSQFSEDATDTDAPSQDTYAPSAIWNGEALRMWRSNRTGAPDTAADIGAAPDTQVVAPVSGTVITVRGYLLYDKYEDYEIHIQPHGWPEVDLILIHVTEPSVAAGDEVLAGVTPIAKVRLLSDRIHVQLADYTDGGGDHVHLQLNEVEVTGKLTDVGGS